MSSGWAGRGTPRPTSCPERLSNEVEALVQRVDMDEEDNMVVLYFDQMTRQESYVTMELEQVTNIKNAKEAIYIKHKKTYCFR